MSWIQALSGVVGLLGGGSQTSSGRAMSARGYGMQEQAIGNSGELYRRALQEFNNREAQGAYNAEATLKLLSEMSSAALGKADRNTAGQLATLGYKRGDSPFAQKAGQNSEAANFKLRGDLLSTQQAFDQKKNADLGFVSNVGSQYNNLLSGIGGQNIQQGQQMQSQGLNTIGNLIGNGGLDINWDFLKKRKSSGSGGGYQFI